MPFKTVEEAQKAFDDLQLKFTDIEQKYFDLETEKNGILKEVIARKNRIKEMTAQNSTILKTLEEAGLDPKGDIKNQIEEKFEEQKATGAKGKVPSTELEKVMKKLEASEKARADFEARYNAAQESSKLEKARNAFMAEAKDSFDDIDLVIDHAANRGLLALDENGNPVIKNGDETVPLKTEKGSTGVDVLKKLYPRQIKTQQKGGGKDTSTTGGKNNTGDNILDFDAFNALSHAERQAFVAKGGKVE
jgi:hypothetical protein